MRIGFDGRVTDEKRVRAGFIGCGSHGFRNIMAAMQFTPIELVATCDLDGEKAAAFAKQFGAERSYDDPATMLASDDLDAVFIVTNYDERGRPRYPDLVVQAVEAGKHAWIEKPPASSCAEIERMQAAAAKHDRQVMVGLKKAFAPGNRKAAELARRKEFGPVSLITLQYPQAIPTPEAFAAYRNGTREGSVVAFLDHLCHPMSLLVMLHGMPRDLVYQRAATGAGMATFTYEDGAVASLALTRGAAYDATMERTLIVSDNGLHILVENNTKVRYCRRPPDLGYGTSPSFFTGEPEQTTAVWEPECSLGQLYNKGLFLLGYWSELQAFAEAVRDGKPLPAGTLEHAWQVTRIFEAFAEGPGKVIPLVS